MRDVNISKKELNDLVEELMKSLDSVDFDEYESILDIPKPTQNRQRKPRYDVEKIPQPKFNITSGVNYVYPATTTSLSSSTLKSTTQSSPTIKPLPSMNNNENQYSLTTPTNSPQKNSGSLLEPNSLNLSQVRPQEIVNNPISPNVSNLFNVIPQQVQNPIAPNASNISNFMAPQVSENPISPNFNLSNIMPQQIAQSTIAPNASNLPNDMPQQTAPNSILPNALNFPCVLPQQTTQHSLASNTSRITSSPFKINLPVEQLNPYQGATMRNGIIELPQYQQVIVIIPTIDIIQKQQQLSRMNSELPLNTEIKAKPSSNSDCLEAGSTETTASASTSKKKPKPSFTINRTYQRRLYKNMSHVKPLRENVDHKTINGFTNEQRKLFDQQMRIHIQFATQTFMQTYKHPLLSNYAPEFKRFLSEINERVNEMAQFNAIERFHNLRNAVELANNWEIELSQDNSENCEYINFIKKENEHYKKLPYQYSMKFGEKILKAICHSDVFMYANLLPKIPFKEAIREKCTFFVPVED